MFPTTLSLVRKGKWLLSICLDSQFSNNNSPGYFDRKKMINEEWGEIFDFGFFINYGTVTFFPPHGPWLSQSSHLHVCLLPSLVIILKNGLLIILSEFKGTVAWDGFP
jgi:hypothetical protein